MSEKPIILGGGSERKTDTPAPTDKICIVHFQRNTTDTIIKPLTDINIAKLRQVATLRLSKSDPYARQEDVCQSIPNEIDKVKHGIHRRCYQIFTDISKNCEKRSLPQEPSVLPIKRACNATLVLFPKDCLFCKKYRKWVSRKTAKRSGFEKAVKCVTHTAAMSIQVAAENQADQRILCEIQGVDLVARELHYHESRRKDFTRDPERHSQDTKTNQNLQASKIAHEKAFKHLLGYIDDNLIG